MNLRIISSGSVGNCYLFEAKNETLIVELGVSFKILKQALDFDFSKVVGAIVTHEHGDHAKAVPDALKAGIDVYASRGTLDAIGAKHHRTFGIANKQVFHLGGFKIMPFDVKHDCKEPFGYLISHAECGNVLFITDSYYVPYKFENLHNVIVEANYSEAIINERLISGKLNGFVRDRVIQSHLSLETCKQLLSANDLSKVNNIVLIHLSDGNADAKQFQKEVTQHTGKRVFVAEKGLNIELNKTPF